MTGSLPAVFIPFVFLPVMSAVLIALGFGGNGSSR